MKDLEEGVRMLFDDFTATESGDYHQSVEMAVYLLKILKRAGIGAQHASQHLDLSLEKEAIYRNGKYHDLKIAGITKREFLELKEKNNW